MRMFLYAWIHVHTFVCLYAIAPKKIVKIFLRFLALSHLTLKSRGFVLFTSRRFITNYASCLKKISGKRHKLFKRFGGNQFDALNLLKQFAVLFFCLWRCVKIFMASGQGNLKLDEVYKCCDWLVNYDFSVTFLFVFLIVVDAYRTH